jgi:hypothetical protein
MIKKAQAWGFDLMIAMVIFLIGLMVFFVYSINYSNTGIETFENLIRDGNFIAENLLSEGYPINWNASNVQTMGIMSGGRIDPIKLERFYNFSIQDYQKTKMVLNTNYDYLFLIEGGINLTNSVIPGIGDYEIENASDLVRINRFAVYNNKLVNVYIYVANK